MPRRPAVAGGGIFGPSVQNVKRQNELNRIGQSGLIADLGFGGRAGLAGAQLGAGLTQLFGATDPALEKAQAMQAVQQQVSEAGLQPGTQEFTREVTRLIRVNVGEQEALEAFTRATALERQQADLAEVRAEVAPQDTRGIEQRATALLNADPTIPPQSAVTIAQDPKAWREAMARANRAPTTTNDQRNFEAAQTIPGFAEYLAAKQSRGATKVTVNNFQSKALGKEAAEWTNAQNQQPLPDMTAADASAAGFRPITRAEAAGQAVVAKQQAAAKGDAIEVNNAIDQVRELVDRFSTLSVFSVTDNLLYDAAVDRLSKAIAQLRNPGDAEAADAAQDRILAALPGIAVGSATGAMQTLLRQFEQEATQRAGVAAGSGAAKASDIDALQQQFPGASIRQVR